MVYIKGNFEPCSTEEDIVNICREYVNDEFAEVVQNKFEVLEEENSEEEFFEREREIEASCNNKLETAQEAIQSCINDLKIISDELDDWK